MRSKCHSRLRRSISEDEDDPTFAWGSSKKAYYAGDTADLEIGQDEEVREGPIRMCVCIWAPPPPKSALAPLLNAIEW